MSRRGFAAKSRLLSESHHQMKGAGFHEKHYIAGGLSSHNHRCFVDSHGLGKCPGHVCCGGHRHRTWRAALRKAFCPPWSCGCGACLWTRRGCRPDHRPALDQLEQDENYPWRGDSRWLMGSAIDIEGKEQSSGNINRGPWVQSWVQQYNCERSPLRRR